MNQQVRNFYLIDTASQFGVKENQMPYIITSDLEVCNKVKGQTLTDKELEDAGANIEALVAADHIKSTSQNKQVAQEGENN